MRIALFAPDPAESNGIAAYACAFEQALKKAGVDVLRPYLETDGSNESIARLLQERSVDIMHFEMGGGRSREFISKEQLSKKLPEIKSTMTVHDPERLVWRLDYLTAVTRYHPLLQQLSALLSNPYTLYRERKVASSLSRLITLTATGAEVLRDRMGLDEGKVVTIPHGSWLVPHKAISISPIRILCFGYLYRGKGHEDLLHALASLLKQMPQYRPQLQVTFAGGTNPELAIRGGNRYVDELRDLAKQLNIAELVQFETDLEEAQIAELIQSHSVLVLPYQQSRKLQLLGKLKGASGVLARAIGCGRGVITSSARALPEELAHGIGTVYPAGDSHALQQSLVQILEQPQLLVAWAESAQRLGEERDWPQIGLRFKSLFETILAEN